MAEVFWSRWLSKKTEQALEEAMAEIGRYFKEEEKLESGATSSEATHPSQMEGVTEAIARISSTEPPGQDTDMAPEAAPTDHSPQVTPSKRPATEEEILGPNQRPISVYAAPSSDVPKAALQPHNEAV